MNATVVLWSHDFSWELHFTTHCFTFVDVPVLFDSNVQFFLKIRARFICAVLSCQRVFFSIQTLLCILPKPKRCSIFILFSNLSIFHTLLNIWKERIWKTNRNNLVNKFHGENFNSLMNQISVEYIFILVF